MSIVPRWRNLIQSPCTQILVPGPVSVSYCSISIILHTSVYYVTLSQGPNQKLYMDKTPKDPYAHSLRGIGLECSSSHLRVTQSTGQLLKTNKKNYPHLATPLEIMIHWSQVVLLAAIILRSILDNFNVPPGLKLPDLMQLRAGRMCLECTYILEYLGQSNLYHLS